MYDVYDVLNAEKHYDILMPLSEESWPQTAFNGDILHYDVHIEGINNNVAEGSTNNSTSSHDHVCDLSPSQI